MQQENQILSISSESFDPDMSREYQLVIDGTIETDPVLAFFDRTGFLMYHSPYSVFKSKWPSHPLQGLDLLSVRFTVSQIGSTIIPEELYEQSQDAVYQHYIQDDGLTSVRKMRLKKLGVWFLYREYLSALGSLVQIFPDAERKPLSGLWLEWLVDHSSRRNGTLLALHFEGDDTLHTAVLNKGKLFYHSVHQIYKQSHLQYLLLKICTETGLNFQGTEVLISGNIEQNDDNYQVVRKYTENISLPDQHRLMSLLLAKI